MVAPARCFTSTGAALARPRNHQGGLHDPLRPGPDTAEELLLDCEIGPGRRWEQLMSFMGGPQG